MRGLVALLLFTFAWAGPKVMLLKTYHDQNITGWVMSEKLDGIRAYWDGKHLLTRKGHIIHAPKWFLAKYPPFAIDGKLWSKRGDFEHIASIVRDRVPGKGWREIKHYIFDVPNAKGDLFARLQKVRPFVDDVIRIIPQYPIHSRAQLQSFFHQIVQNGGEGVVVRDPKARYERKRSSKILKLKPFLDDECEVVGYTKGKGKYEGLVGALRCRLKSGQTIKLGSGLKKTDRIDPPKIGDIVTFKYNSLTKKGLPRFPVFLRMRERRKGSIIERHHPSGR